jgi:hypothetical protein
MASFTDAITQFNPYVPQLPVDAMVKVGMQKQAQYEEGYKKIQAQIDQVAGLDVLRDVDKNYLQSKLNELGNNLTGVAAGDFSNFQLVNSVAGMTKQVAKDEYVQAAVSSTANHRKQAAEIEADRKKGTLTPDNEYYYNKQLSSYISSKDLKDKNGNPIVYSGKYIPNFDVFKFAKETFDAVKPDGFSFDQVYVTDENGNPKIDPKTKQPIYSPVMVRMEQEGIFPAKVKETLNQIFSDPRVGQQLSISGQYNYRNMTPDQLSGKILDQKESILASYENQLLDLNLKKNSGKDVQKDIDSVTQQMQSVASAYDEYAQTAFDNPDGVKGQLYKDDLSSRFTTMFGQIKKKEQMMENPGWRANFELQKEANAQSRFAQDLHQRKLEFTEKNKQWEADYLQKERLAIDKKKGVGTGTGPDGDKTTEQADQPSDIDKIQKLEQDYTDAATEFQAGSDEFLWNNAFSGVGNNDANLAKLINSGKMNRSEAISLMITNAARSSNQDPITFRANWGNKAEVNYFKMTPQQREANPSLTAAYTAYRDSRKTFDVISSIKKQVDDQTEDSLGQEGAKKTNILGFVPDEQFVTFRGNKVKLTKNDIYDLAVYVRGNKSTFGFMNDEGANRAAKTAYQRLKLKGLGDLADYQLDINTANPTLLTSTPITGGLRTIKAGLKTILHPSDYTDAFIVTGQVKDVFDKINSDEYEKGLSIKAGIIDKAYGMKPNLKVGLVSGDVSTDKVTFSKIKNWAGAYTAGQTENLSPDFKKFAESLGKNLEESNIEAQIIIDGNNKPQVELVSYDSDGKRSGGMTIQKDEAANIGIDVNSLYESKEVSVLRNKINYNGNKTCEGNPKDITTYVNGDVYYDRHDFKGMGNAPYDVRANIIYRNGIYYPVIFASDGKNMTKVPRELEGSENLQQVELFLKQAVNPTYVSSIIAESEALNK